MATLRNRNVSVFDSIPMERRIALYVDSMLDWSARAAQEMALRDHAAEAGYTVLCVLHGEGLTGARRARRSAMALARRRVIDAILVETLACWGEGIRPLSTSLARLSRWGVSLLAVNGVTLDLQTGQGSSAVDLLQAFAEMEHAVRSARIRSGVAAARRPQDIGHAQALLAESLHRLAAIHDASKSGASYRKIAARLGVSKNTAMKMVELGRPPRGLVIPYLGEPSRRCTGKVTAEAIQASRRAIAGRLGLSVETFDKLLALGRLYGDGSPVRDEYRWIGVDDWPPTEEGGSAEMASAADAAEVPDGHG